MTAAQAPHLAPRQCLNQSRVAAAALVAVPQLAAKALAPGEQPTVCRHSRTVEGAARHLQVQTVGCPTIDLQRRSLAGYKPSRQSQQWQAEPHIYISQR